MYHKQNDYVFLSLSGVYFKQVLTYRSLSTMNLPGRRLGQRILKWGIRRNTGRAGTKQQQK